MRRCFRKMYPASISRIKDVGVHLDSVFASQGLIFSECGIGRPYQEFRSPWQIKSGILVHFNSAIGIQKSIYGSPDAIHAQCMNHHKHDSIPNCFVMLHTAESRWQFCNDQCGIRHAAMDACVYYILIINIHKINLEVVFFTHFEELLLFTLNVHSSDFVGFDLLSMSPPLTKWLCTVYSRSRGLVCGHILSSKGPPQNVHSHESSEPDAFETGLA